MTDDKKGPVLPDDHGQFGTDNATEDYQRLKDANKPIPTPRDADGGEL